MAAQVAIVANEGESGGSVRVRVGEDVRAFLEGGVERPFSSGLGEDLPDLSEVEPAPRHLLDVGVFDGLWLPA